MKQRSRVKLTCVVNLGRGLSSDSAAVFWYLDGRSLDWLGQVWRSHKCTFFFFAYKMISNGSTEKWSAKQLSPDSLFFSGTLLQLAH